MTTSKKTFKLSKFFPAYTVAEWLDTYQGFIETIYTTPNKSKKGIMWEDFIQLVNEVKMFLKNNGVKFI